MLLPTNYEKNQFEHNIQVLQIAMQYEDKRLFTKARRFIVTHAHSIRKIHGFEVIKDASILCGIIGDIIDEVERAKLGDASVLLKEVSEKKKGAGENGALSTAEPFEPF